MPMIEHVTPLHQGLLADDMELPPCPKQETLDAIMRFAAAYRPMFVKHVQSAGANLR